MTSQCKINYHTSSNIKIGVFTTEWHQYIPNASLDLGLMLQITGISSIEELFSDLPASAIGVELNDEPLDEAAVKSRVVGELSKNRVYGRKCFIGGGPWFHIVPSVVKHLISRGEFLTSYTPYQPEISQGMLQTLFEYQSLVCELYGMDVANSSLYDLPTAIGEAILLSCRVTRRKKALVPASLPRERISVISNYLEPHGIDLVKVSYDGSGKLERSDLFGKIDETAASVYVENPSFFGTIDKDIEEVTEAAHRKGCLAIVGADPISLGMIKPPGEYGADIAVGEGQPLGSAPGFGGNSLGIMACRLESSLIRQMPGRIVGMTMAFEGGERGFVLALSTREQHIRREKATSNICTNEGLLAAAAAIYLSLLGKQGLRELARGIFARTDYALHALKKAGFAPRFSGIHFRDFAIATEDPRKINSRLAGSGLSGGRDLRQDFGLSALLFAVTEVHTKEDIDGLARAMGEGANGK